MRFLVRERRATYNDIEGAREVQGSFGARGVRFRVSGIGTWYFWTKQPERVLAFVRNARVPIIEGCPRLPLVYSKAWQ
jgi:hypothetical protein